MLHHWDGIGQMLSSAWFPPDMMLRIEAKQFNLGFIRLEYHVSHSLSVLYMLFCELQIGFHVSITDERLPSGHSALKCAVMVVLLDASPISTQLSSHSDPQGLGHLSNQGSSPPDCSVWPGGQF